jgi:hypothetical protein
MNASNCSRSWEAEAARDGRLTADLLASHELHLLHCAQCAHERQALERLTTELRAGDSHNELVLRRLRQRLLVAMNHRALGIAAGGPGTAPARVAAALLVAALIGLAWFATSRPQAPAAVTLRLAPEPGARFVHERRPGLEYVELHEGALRIDFERGPTTRLLVHVPDGEIRDLGTVFRVVVAAGKTTEISVQQGAVVFRRTDEADVVVSAGEVFMRAPEELPRESFDEWPNTGADRVDQSRRVGSPAKGQARHRHAAPAKAQAAPRNQPIAGTQQAARPATEQQDVAYLRILALLQESRHAEAQVAAQEYLSRFPNGFRRDEVERIIAPGAR